MLRLSLDSLLSQTVGEAVFIDFLKVSVPQISVEGESGFSDGVAKLEDGIFHGGLSG
jgi:hypothetical protein